MISSCIFSEVLHLKHFLRWSDFVVFFPYTIYLPSLLESAPLALTFLIAVPHLTKKRGLALAGARRMRLPNRIRRFPNIRKRCFLVNIVVTFIPHISLTIQSFHSLLLDIQQRLYFANFLFFRLGSNNR